MSLDSRTLLPDVAAVVVVVCTAALGWHGTFTDVECAGLFGTVLGYVFGRNVPTTSG